jgi:nucleoside-diphosphate-sugar epimerase
MIVISGIRGWLGNSAVNVLVDDFFIDPNEIVGIGSQRNIEKIGRNSYQVKTWEDFAEGIKDVQLFLHFGFLTRDKVAKLPFEEYLLKNREITNQALNFIRINSPKAVVNISSGAVFDAPTFTELTNDVNHNPYGFLKLEEERRLQEICNEKNIGIVINRLWGLSGSDVKNKEPYALYEFIKKSQENEVIEIQSKNLVFRRYVNDRQLMKLLLKLGFTSESLLFDSGGPLIEVEDLARLVVRTLNSKSNVLKRDIDPQVIKDEYYSKNSKFEEIFALNMSENLLSLEEQIILSASGAKNVSGGI